MPEGYSWAAQPTVQPTVQDVALSGDDDDDNDNAADVIMGDVDGGDSPDSGEAVDEDMVEDDTETLRSETIQATDGPESDWETIRSDDHSVEGGATPTTSEGVGSALALIPAPPNEIPSSALGGGLFALPGSRVDCNLSSRIVGTVVSYHYAHDTSSPEYAAWQERSVPGALRLTWNRDPALGKQSSTDCRIPHQWVGKWWFRDEQDFANQVQEAMRNQFNHVARIMETDLGEVVTGASVCQRCAASDHECARYKQIPIPNEVLVSPGNVCARCRLLNKPCVPLTGPARAKRAAPQARGG